MSEEIIICTLNGVQWALGEESEKLLNWNAALTWCKSIGQELPPREVLLIAYLSPEIKGSFANNFYWSSTDNDTDSDYAWAQYFDDGYQNQYNKYNIFAVRAVRRIT